MNTFSLKTSTKYEYEYICMKIASEYSHTNKFGLKINSNIFALKISPEYSPVQHVLIIHSNVESGPKMILFTIQSEIFIKYLVKIFISKLNYIKQIIKNDVLFKPWVKYCKNRIRKGKICKNMF